MLFALLVSDSRKEPVEVLHGVGCKNRGRMKFLLQLNWLFACPLGKGKNA